MMQVMELFDSKRRGNEGAPELDNCDSALERNALSKRASTNYLALITTAASIRLTDPKAEYTRIALLGATFDVTRTASEAMHLWLSRCIAEYRGSRTAWDLPATGLALHIALTRYETWMPHAVAELSSLIPDLRVSDADESQRMRDKQRASVAPVMALVRR